MHIINRKRVCLLIISLLTFIFMNVKAEEEDPLLTLTLKSVRLDKALKAFSEKTGKNFIPANMEIGARKINLSLDGVPIDEAISIFMETNKLGYRKQPGTNYFLVDEISKIVAFTEIRSFHCEYAEVTKLVEVLGKIVTPGIGSVFGDERTNTIIIRESPDVLRNIEELMKELDRPTPQIYIQAAIVEVTLADNVETGVEWLWKDPSHSGVQGRAATSFNLRSSESSGETSSQSADGIIEKLLPAGNGLGVGLMNAHVDVVLHALQDQYKMNLLSRPKLVTLDNEESVIEVGDQIPYKVLSEYGYTSYEFKNATIKLLVRPHINNDHTITVFLEPSADFQNGLLPDGTPIIAMRKAKTKVKANNGSTIVIGGIIRETESKSFSKVPVLGSIPLLGRLFRHEIRKLEKTELVIFLTPLIIKDEDVRSTMQEEFKIKSKVENNFN